MTRVSLRDQRMIAELESGREQLLSAPSLQGLLSGLRRKMLSISRNLYVISWIPEQYEDLYDVLVDGKTIVHIEVPRDARSDEVVFEKFDVNEYLKTRKYLTKPDRRRLELALKLARQRTGSGSEA